MRSICEVGEHSIMPVGLHEGAIVIDAGANHGFFSNACKTQFRLEPVLIEANPELAIALRNSKMRVVECALGQSNGSTIFHIGSNDESSSVRKPNCANGHLQIKGEVEVRVRNLPTIIQEEELSDIVLVKLDIEGAEIEVLQGIAPTASKISPQWTVEFHDDPEFGLCSKAEVDSIIYSMKQNGFSVLIRNWPSRTNVLFVDRKQLKITTFKWLFVKLRYQVIAFLWRKFKRL